MMLVFAVWPQTSCHNELTRALVLAFVYRHWKWHNSGRYECIYNITCWVYTPHSLFRQLIPPRLHYPVKIRSSDLIHRSFWMPMWTARLTALVRRSARVHIGDVTVYVTWHVLWRTQWTLTTGMVVVTIGVKPAHLQLSDSTMGPVLWGVYYILIIFWQRPEN